jgi:hypothetical protein
MSDEGARRIARSRQLPGSRTLVGGLLVTTAAVGAFATSGGAGSGFGHRYVVAAQPLVVGQRVTAGDLGTDALELSERVAHRAYQSPDELIGAVVVAPVEAGELVQASAVVSDDRGDTGDAGDGGVAPTHEFSFPIEREWAVNAEIRRGEWIDVLATYGSGETATTTVVARRARLVALAEGSTAIGSSGTVVLTVGVDSADVVLELAHAARSAEITVVRSTRAGDTVASVDRFPPASATP